MGNNANKIVAVVAAVLVVAVIAMVMGSVGNVGGGGGPVAPAPSSTNATQQGSESLPANGSEDTGDMTLDEFEALLDAYDAQQPVGENARDAATSPDVPSVSTVYQEVEQRGFDEAEVQADFDINGTYHDPETVDEASGEKYPSYSMYYTSTQNVIWIVFVNDGNYIAVALGEDGGETFQKEIILTESSTITQYDGTRNQFSEFDISQIDDAVCIQVARIDKDTLDSYSPTQLEAM